MLSGWESASVFCGARDNGDVVLEAARDESTCANRFCRGRDEDLPPSFAMLKGGIRGIAVI